ncbi:unnamed protein product, partial [Rotaria magnacalcarata]
INNQLHVIHSYRLLLANRIGTIINTNSTKDHLTMVWIINRIRTVPSTKSTEQLT